MEKIKKLKKKQKKEPTNFHKGRKRNYTGLPLPPLTADHRC